VPPAGAAAAAAEILAGDQLRDLAHLGHKLYRMIFSDPRLSAQLDELRPGDRLDLTWYPWGGVAVPRIPLGLLYRVPPQEPVDPLEFLGLRFRLHYRVHPTPNRLPALPGWRGTNRLHALYWGEDELAAETARHRQELDRWAPPPHRLPDGADQLVDFLRDPPDDPPLALVYVFARLDPGSGTGPALRFGSKGSGGRRGPDVVRATDLGTRPLRSGPVVFMNVCDSGGSGLVGGNQLERDFLDRGARSYIGTEAKVPAGMAARFGTTFLRFLLDAGSWPDQTPVGEAMAQARIFLWEEFRSLAGLFYGHVNDSPFH
jgi:hypothetical protein